MWLYALLLVIFCLNHVVDPALAGGTQTPAGYASGTISDVSVLLPFKFWQPVYYLTDPTDRSFPGDSEEKRGRWVGISENIGGHITFIIITDDGKGSRIERSILCPVDSKMPNYRADKESDADLDHPKELRSDAIYGYQEDIETVPILPEMMSSDSEESKPEKHPIGTTIRRKINNEWHTGIVKNYDESREYYWIEYDDIDDAEEMDHKTLDRHIKSTSSPSKTRRSPRSKQRDVSPTTNSRYPLCSKPNFDTDSFDKPNPPPAPIGRSQHRPTAIRSCLSEFNIFEHDLSVLPPDSPISNQPDTVVYLKDYGEKLKFLADQEDDNSDTNSTIKSTKEESKEKDANKESPPPWEDEPEDFEIVLRDEYGTVKLDSDGNPITMNCRPPTDLVGRVFLTKPDPRGNRYRARIIEVVKEYEDEVNVNKNPINRKFRI